MKNLITFLTAFFLTGLSVFAQVGINADNSDPDASAMLDVKGTDKGLLPPRVALTATNSAIPVTNPATGLLVYNTAVSGTPPNNVSPGYYRWSSAQWVRIESPAGINIGDMQYWDGTQWVRIPAGSNGQVLMFNSGVPTWEQPSSLCGISVTINHVAGLVAPVSKTVTYGTVTNIPGEPAKCWITSNLGADHQATSADDATEASGGWFWQFNRKQGYKHDGTNRTPASFWFNAINESSNWTTATDPCSIELGAGWRIPTSAEWTNVDGGGNWTNWNGSYGSPLKLHAAGYLDSSIGALYARGTNGFYWSSTPYSNTYGIYLVISNSGSQVINNPKSYGFSVRCLKDN